MRLLHSADWHLGSPLGGREYLKPALESVPFQVVEAARASSCDALLLAGDLFDGEPSRDQLQLVMRALAEAEMPVFLAPGNHDPLGPGSPWLQECWPENVHIFTGPHMESIAVPGLDCRIYGAGFRGPESGPLLENFCADGQERWCIGLLHGDPLTAASAYNPVSRRQIADSALDYLALGHIHQQGMLRSGATVCAWPGCPMGRGFDETGEKGVLLVELEEDCRVEFLPLQAPRFYDLEISAQEGPYPAVEKALQPLDSRDTCRITLTGEAEPFAAEALRSRFPQYPHLQLRDRTVPPVALWENAGADTLEGLFFGRLRDSMEGQEEARRQQIRLAARISRQLLLGQEVKLP